MPVRDLTIFHNPSSVAVVGASDDPDKIGGRPIRYMGKFGYRGSIYPVNPTRAEVQTLPAYGSLQTLPQVPEVVIIAVAGDSAVEAVLTCAKIGVKGVVIFASGFAETDDPAAKERQRIMDDAAARARMAMVGPNTQGLASFHTGTILSFSTMFLEQPPADGPVGIVSQSGAMCGVPYGLLRRRGIGVRYAHASGNDSDVSVGELLGAVVADDEIELVLCYLESIRDPRALEDAANLANARGIPIVALVGGRSADGKRAASSHTGALANEVRIVDAFFERYGIWRATSTAELVGASEMYLQGWKPKGKRLSVVSNSGAACVLAADVASDFGIELATLSPSTCSVLDAVLPQFASKANPVDITAALLTDSSLVGKVLDPMAADDAVDACLLAIPVSGRGYDYPRFAADAATFTERAGKPLVVTSPQEPVAAAFREAGCVVFEEEYGAIAALAQFSEHRALQSRAARRRGALSRRRPSGSSVTLNEVESLSALAALGLPVVAHRLCSDPMEAAGAFETLGADRVVVKGVTADATHKSELGLVRLGLTSADEVASAARDCLAALEANALRADGVVVAVMLRGVREVLLGAHLDPIFGPVVVVGNGGKYVEAIPDVALLLPPFDVDEALRAIWGLEMAPLLRGVRDEPAATVDQWASAAVRLGEAMTAEGSDLQSVDANPFILGPVGTASVSAIVDAVVLTGRYVESQTRPEVGHLPFGADS